MFDIRKSQRLIDTCARNSYTFAFNRTIIGRRASEPDNGKRPSYATRRGGGEGIFGEMVAAGQEWVKGKFGKERLHYGAVCRICGRNGWDPSSDLIEAANSAGIDQIAHEMPSMPKRNPQTLSRTQVEQHTKQSHNIYRFDC